MTTLTEGNLAFAFPGDWEASQYDEWAFYRNQFQRVVASKAVDFVCVAGQSTWLIEVKDYRSHSRTKASMLHDEVAAKVRDTLAGLAAAAANASDAAERQVARRALAKRRWRVVLHLRQSIVATRFKPNPIDPTVVQAKLRRAVRSIDPHPLVVEGDAGVPWRVQSAS